MRNIIKKIGSTILSATVLVSTLSSLTSYAAELELAKWTLEKGADTEISLDTLVARGGNSLKFVTKSSAAASTTVPVVAGETYKAEFYVRGTNVSSANVTIGGASYSLKPVASTFEWTRYSFEYKSQSDNPKLNIRFAVSGLVQGFWLDSISFYNVNDKNVNLIENPDFLEGAETDEIESEQLGSLEEQFNSIKKKDTFTVDALNSVLGGLRNIPIEKAENIAIDGKMDDWEEYGVAGLPTLSSQYVYYDKAFPMDINAGLKMAYDEKGFYFACRVQDDIHTYEDSSNYWQKDGIQFALSRKSDSYGYEIGLMYNSDTGASNIYTTALTDTEIKAMNYKATREGDITTYEIFIPWTIYYGSVQPDDMLFGFLINENDGTGRKNCLELSPGIAEGKTNAEFPFLEFISDDNTWYSWLDGERKPTINTDYTYDFFFVNYSQTADFEFEMPNGEKVTATVPENTGVRKEIKINFEDSGANDITVKVNGDKKVKFNVNVMPNKSKVDKYTLIFNNQLKEIEKLMRKCDKQGIAYDDERAYYKTVEMFVGFMNDDAGRGDFSKTDYFVKELSELCDGMIASLNAYLNGEKISVPAPNYVVTGNDKIVGSEIYATNEINGTIVEMPTTFIGFGHFGTIAKTIPEFRDYGFNTLQLEVGPSTLLRWRGDVPNWAFEVNGAKAKATVTDVQKASGNKALSLSNTSAVQPNVFASLTQSLLVKPNTTYRFGFKIKARQAIGFWYTLNNFDNRNFLPEDVSDWTDIESTFTTGENQEFAIFKLAIDGPMEECYIDDVYVYEEGSDVNLLENPGFENEDDTIFWELNYHYFQTMLGWINDAEKNNAALTLLISPHYLTDGLKDKYPELYPGTQHTSPNYNVNSDIARQYIEEYLRAILPLIKDKKSIQTITLANEPHLGPAGNTGFYQPRWEEYLKNKYGTIERLNDAWARQYNDFSEITMPLTQSYDMQYYDYMLFTDEQFQSWYLFMKDIIREYTDVPVNVKIMTTTGEHDHQGVDRRYKTAFGMNPEPHAEFCEISGNDAILFPNWVMSGEEGELEKSFYYDYQISLRNAPVANTEDHIIFDQDSTYNDFYADFVETDLWQGAVHGRTISDIWTWERAGGNTTSVFNGLFLDRPDCVAEVSHVNNDLARYAFEVSAIKNEKRDVAILYSISSRIYQPEYMNSVYKTYEAVAYNGKRPHILNEEIIGKLSECKVLIIPRAVHCKASAVAEINKFVENGGKVLILGEDSLQLTEETNTKNDEAVVKNILSKAKVYPCKPDGYFLSEPTDVEYCDYVEEFLRENNMQYVRLVDAESGETTDNIEWLHGTKDGKLYININNYNIGETKNVKIEVGGKIITASKELRSQTAQGEVITLEPYSPILLEIEN